MDVKMLRVEVERLSEKVWQQEDAVKESDFFCFAHSQHVIFRFIPGQPDASVLLFRSGLAGLDRYLLPAMPGGSQQSRTARGVQRRRPGPYPLHLRGVR